MPRRKKDKIADSDPVINVLDVGDGFSEPAPPPSPVIDAPTVEIKDAPPISDDAPKGKRPYTKRTKKIDEEGNPLIDGEMLLLLVDVIVPMIIAMGHNMFSDSSKAISPDNLMLTEKQKESMKRFADKAAERIDINAHPVAVLLIGLGGIYTMNYLNEKGKK
jgi:hypothetical protein